MMIRHVCDTPAFYYIHIFFKLLWYFRHVCGMILDFFIITLFNWLMMFCCERIILLIGWCHMNGVDCCKIKILMIGS
jgi:hypothetical protein